MSTPSVLLLVLFCSMNAFGQTSFTGIWEGKLKVGVELTMIFHITTDSSGKMNSTLSCPEQGLKNTPSTIQINGDSLHIDISRFGARYRGVLQSDSTISGKFEQGVSLPLNLRKVNKVTEISRSQTPAPPFPYKVEELLYTNSDKSIRYGATITIPEGKGPFPAVLLLTGSGQQNRDEEIMGHKPFAVIADYLTRQGIVVLRVDDRGMGQTTGDIRKATSRDFADDATVSLQLLLTRKEVNKKKMGLVGHSEGGMIAQMLAAERTDIAFIILLAAPGEPVMQLMKGQNEAILRKAGLSQEYTSAYLKLYGSILNSIVTSEDSIAMNSNVAMIVDKWIDETPVSIVSRTTGIRDSVSKQRFIRDFVTQLDHPWFRYFLSYQPATMLKKVRAKVLALNGSEDVQVVSKPNLAAIEQGLKQGHSPKFDVKEIAGLNHLFQECKTCTVTEYGQLDQTISPAVLQIISDWIKVNIR